MGSAAGQVAAAAASGHATFVVGKKVVGDGNLNACCACCASSPVGGAGLLGVVSLVAGNGPAVTGAATGPWAGLAATGGDRDAAGTLPPAEGGDGDRDAPAGGDGEGAAKGPVLLGGLPLAAGAEAGTGAALASGGGGE